MADIIKRVANLMTVKSLVTLILTIVFAFLAVTGKIAQDFMTIYAVIIAFYFGTQAQRTSASEAAGSKADTINNYYEIPEALKDEIRRQAGDGTETEETADPIL